MNQIDIDRSHPELHGRQSYNERSQQGHRVSEPDIVGYEDGLVHEHNWACRERGAEAHR